MKPVYILGGYQTDFSRNWSREGKHVSALFREVLDGLFQKVQIVPQKVQAAHVGNFAGELYTHQGHYGAFVVEGCPELEGIPTARHEAACASGSIAALAASAEIEAGRYDCVAVIGVEQMKTVSPSVGGDYLGTAAWYEREATGVEFPFPKLFGKLGDEYERRYGLKSEHLAEISAINYKNARLNPNAQTRHWYMSKQHACSEGKYNAKIGDRIKITDCSQVTDGAAALILASAEFASDFVASTGRSIGELAQIQGWGQRTARLCFADKVAHAEPYLLPQTRAAITDAFTRARIADVFALDGIETHDCFTTSEYMAIDHFGVTPPGESWKAIEDGTITTEGRLPINPSGGLIGAGHPVGATGVRQLLDACKQVTGAAGDYQVDGASRFGVLNIGGSGTSSCAFVVGR